MRENKEKIRILCYGDSNTFGYIPGRGGRYDRHVRWPRLLGELLGDAYQVIEEGLCGRTTVFEDITEPGRCGLDQIEKTVEQYAPLDLLIVMLGSNDCKVQFAASAEQITAGIEQVTEKVKNCAGILLIAPAAMTERVVHSGFGSEFDRHSVEVSKELAENYEKAAKQKGYGFLDGSKAAKVSRMDGLHLDMDGHRMLAEAVCKWVKQWKQDQK